MRPESFECVTMTNGSASLPLRSVQGPVKATSLAALIFLSVVAACVIVPLLALAGYALQSAEIRQAILSQPIVSFQLLAAILLWLFLFAWPLKSLFSRLTWRRAVEITSESVAVRDTRSFGDSNWTAPLSSYKGIAHHTRSSLSGTRQELVLVHPDARRSVLLLTAEHISGSDISRITRLLALPQIAAAELYRLGSIGERRATGMSFGVSAA